VSDDVPRGRTAQFPIADAAGRIAESDTVRSVPLFRHGSMLVKYYAPRGEDRQTPHAQDEVYVVARGSGVFFDGTTRRRFGPGDLIFAAAGVAHRFEQFSDDFGVWVVFYGPDGGEPD
jgi:mannose-6-phosphate isomerase-like protein (cupin superfamily)